ncbi:MAG: hypothetical protein GXP45_04055 [bacterium]|nr:hypothetical protein [bacterium]
MHIKEEKLAFVDATQIFSFSEEFDNGIQFVTYISFENDKFLDYQKDLLQEFLAGYLDQLKTDIYELDNVKANFEIALETLNTKLKLFADKVRDVDHFGIK